MRDIQLDSSEHPLGSVMTNAYVLWFVIALVLVAAELFTGTFLLLMVAIGFAAGGLTALLGGALEWQLLIGAAVGAIGIYVVRKMGWARRGKRLYNTTNADILIDIGQSVQVWEWRDGHARVTYRGAQWDAVLESANPEAGPGRYVINAIRGSTLVLAPEVPTSPTSPTSPV